MKFLHYEVEADITNEVQVFLRGEAVVKLLDSVGYARYKVGKPHDYRGGVYSESVVSFKIQAKKKWHIIIEPTKGSVSASIELLNC